MAEFDYTSNQILTLPAYTSTTKPDQLSVMPDFVPHQKDVVGVDFLRMAESDSLDIAYTLSCTKKKLNPAAQGTLLQRIENVLKRKFHLAKINGSIPRQNGDDNLASSLVDNCVFGFLYIHPHNSQSKTREKCIKAVNTIKNNLRSCLKPMKLSVGPEWFELLQMAKDPTCEFRTALRDKLIRAILNEPKTKIPTPNDSLSYRLVRVDYKFDQYHTLQITDKSLNLIDFNVNQSVPHSIHRKTSKVSFNWKVQQRQIPNTIIYAVSSKNPMSYPLNDTLLKIDTILDNRDVYVLPVFARELEEFQSLIESIDLTNSMFIQPLIDEPLQNQLGEYLKSIQTSTSNCPPAAEKSAETRVAQLAIVPYVKEAELLSGEHEIFNPTSIVIDFIAERGKNVLMRIDTILETLFLFGRLSRFL